MDELIKSCEPLIKSIANKFYGIDKEDLMQAGRTGLINAYKHYNKNDNTKFSTFAYSYIFGEMYNLSVNNRTIKTNRDTLKLVKLIEKTKSYLTQKLGKIPSLSEVASYLEMDENVLSNAYVSTETILSLDMPSIDDYYLYNSIKCFDDNDISLDIKNSINELSKDEQEIIKYRYYNDLTQSETAKLLGLSQVKVSRSEQKSLKKLKTIMSYE